MTPWQLPAQNPFMSPPSSWDAASTLVCLKFSDTSVGSKPWVLIISGACNKVSAARSTLQDRE